MSRPGTGAAEMEAASQIFIGKSEPAESGAAESAFPVHLRNAALIHFTFYKVLLMTGHSRLGHKRVYKATQKY